MDVASMNEASEAVIATELQKITLQPAGVCSSPSRSTHIEERTEQKQAWRIT